MKQVLFFLFFAVAPVLLDAQQQADSVTFKKDSIVKKRASVIAPVLFHDQQGDSSALIKDSIAKQGDSIIDPSVAYKASLTKMLKGSFFLNTTGKPQAMISQVRKPAQQQNYFYVIILVAFLLAFFRYIYTRYFNNLFRVFFNASLRQSQLTDQLMQAKLPSLAFNMLFVFAGGLYIYLLLDYFKWIPGLPFWMVLLYCTGSIIMIYLVKFLTLKFTGWLTGFKEVTNTYIFIIFLINKILGILLIPFVIVIAFSIPDLAMAAIAVSLLLIGLMFLLRFFRSYGLLQHKLKVSKAHFFLYVIGIEVLPLLLIFKALILLLSKNL